MKIGVLAVQGAFIEHEGMLHKLGASCIELRQKSDLTSIDGIILPGGESTVQGKLLRNLDMFETLQFQNQGRASCSCNLCRINTIGKKYRR